MPVPAMKGAIHHVGEAHDCGAPVGVGLGVVGLATIIPVGRIILSQMVLPIGVSVHTHGIGTDFGDHGLTLDYVLGAGNSGSPGSVMEFHGCRGDDFLSISQRLHNLFPSAMYRCYSVHITYYEALSTESQGKSFEKGEKKREGGGRKTI